MEESNRRAAARIRLQGPTRLHIFTMVVIPPIHVGIDCITRIAESDHPVIPSLTTLKRALGALFGEYHASTHSKETSSQQA